MEVPAGAAGLHLHCEHCVKLARCQQAAPVAGERCDLVSCPAGCDRRLHACKLAEHALLCPEERVPCINVEYGCDVVLPRRQRAAHLTSCPASVVLCMAEWNRWPLLTPPVREPHAATERALDESLLERDQSLLRDCLEPARSLARRLRVFPAVPLRLPGTYDCSHLAPELGLDRAAAAAEQAPADPPGLQRSVCGQLASHPPAPSTARDANPSLQPAPPESAVDTYANCECVHRIARDLCKFCRGAPEPVRQVTRHSWQPAPAPGGGLTWTRVTRTERLRERPGKYDLDAVLWRIKQQALDEREAERRQAERDERSAGPRLALTIDSIAVPERSRPRTLYTFQCAQLLRRDEFSDHYRRVHGDVHGGAGGWLQQRCPLAQYGCQHFADRLYPDNDVSRFVISPTSGAVGVTSSDGAGPVWEEGEASQLMSLPFEVLQHIASLLDPFSLNHLSLTCRLLRDVCASLLESRGLVMLMWTSMAHDGGVTWRSVAKAWRFSNAFGPVREMHFHGGAHMADHLPRCALYQPSRAAEPFSLVPVRRRRDQAGDQADQGDEAMEELQQRMDRARAMVGKRTALNRRV